MELTFEQRGVAPTPVVVCAQALEGERFAGVLIDDTIHDRRATASERFLNDVAICDAARRMKLTELCSRRGSAAQG